MFREAGALEDGMRTLRVVGPSEDGASVVCEDPAGGERFELPADDQLRAAARGDRTRLGQIQIEVDGEMRPREIQARIRAGESPEQLAADAGISPQRVDRFAHPVLLERSRTAHLAQGAHPMRPDGPDVRTLAETAAHAFGLRGQDYASASWDSWRGEDGTWVVALRWQAGCSDNSAHWSFKPGAHGGTVTALDEHAEELLHPNAHRAPRTLRAVEPDPAGSAGSAEQGAEHREPAEWTAPETPDSGQASPEQTGYGPHSGQLPPPGPAGQGPAGRAAAGQGAAGQGAAGQGTAGQDGSGSSTAGPGAAGPGGSGDGGSGGSSGDEPTDARAAGGGAARAGGRGDYPAVSGQHAAAGQSSGENPPTDRAARKKAHPIVPAWEDVLLGVRSQRGG